MHAMVILVSFLLKNSMVKKFSSHIKVSYPNPCYNDVFYKEPVHSNTIIQAWS